MKRWGNVGLALSCRHYLVFDKLSLVVALRAQKIMLSQAAPNAIIHHVFNTSSILTGLLLSPNAHRYTLQAAI